MNKIAFFIFILLISHGLYAQEYAKEMNQYRKKKNKEVKSKVFSPNQLKFKKLNYFPPNEKFKVEASFKRTENEAKFQMPTTTSRLPEYVKYGELKFEIDGKSYQLSVFQGLDLMKQKEYEDYLFIPFTDLTCGEESYSGGRYLELKIPQIRDGKVILDFNLAYNPYCAYHDRYSCPIPPKENHLKVRIEAGEQSYASYSSTK
jgi:uncharacterized protein